MGGGHWKGIGKMDVDTVLAHPKMAAVRFEGDHELAKILVDAFNRGRGFKEYRLVGRERTAEKAPSSTKSDVKRDDSVADDEEIHSNAESLGGETKKQRIELQIEKEKTKQKNLQLEMEKARLDHEYRMKLLQ